MSSSPLTRNVTRVYRAATADQIAKGVEWYARARRISVELDPADPVRGAAVIALVSPLTPWGRNVWLAREAYRLHAAGEDVGALLPTLKGNARKVAAVLNGADPHTVVSGLKVRAFWLTIANPLHPDAVVIDRHAHDVAVGQVTSDEVRGKALATPKRYAAYADVYVRAARILSREAGTTVLPSTVQAITWTVWRETEIRTAAAMRNEVIL